MAIDLFEKVLKLRPEEPQSYRDLALALADRADAVSADLAGGKQVDASAESNAKTDYLRAMMLLNKVVVGNWPRFPEVELPVLMEANDIAAKRSACRMCMTSTIRWIPGCKGTWTATFAW